MRITLHGAAGGKVTGSAYLVQTKSANVLMVFGMFQGAVLVGTRTDYQMIEERQRTQTTRSAVGNLP